MTKASFVKASFVIEYNAKRIKENWRFSFIKEKYKEDYEAYIEFHARRYLKDKYLEQDLSEEDAIKILKSNKKENTPVKKGINQ